MTNEPIAYRGLRSTTLYRKMGSHGIVRQFNFYNHAIRLATTVAARLRDPSGHIT